MQKYPYVFDVENRAFGRGPLGCQGILWMTRYPRKEEHHVVMECGSGLQYLA